MQQRLSPFGYLACVVLMALGVPIVGFSQDDANAGARKRLRLKDNVADFWIYDDLQQGFAKAEASDKPLLVSFRCVP